MAPTPAKLGALAVATDVDPAALVDQAATLRGLRALAQLTQSELGHRVGVSQILISRLERGMVELGEDLATRLAAELAVPVAEVRSAYGRAGNSQTQAARHQG